MQERVTPSGVRAGNGPLVSIFTDRGSGGGNYKKIERQEHFQSVPAGGWAMMKGNKGRTVEVLLEMQAAAFCENT